MEAFALVLVKRIAPPGPRCWCESLHPPGAIGRSRSGGTPPPRSRSRWGPRRAATRGAGIFPAFLAATGHSPRKPCGLARGLHSESSRLGGGSRSLSRLLRRHPVRFAHVRAEQDSQFAKARHWPFPAWLLWFVITQGEGFMCRFLLSLGRLLECTAVSLVLAVTDWLLRW